MNKRIISIEFRKGFQSIYFLEDSMEDSLNCSLKQRLPSIWNNIKQF